MLLCSAEVTSIPCMSVLIRRMVLLWFFWRLLIFPCLGFFKFNRTWFEDLRPDRVTTVQFDKAQWDNLSFVILGKINTIWSYLIQSPHVSVVCTLNNVWKQTPYIVFYNYYTANWVLSIPDSIISKQTVIYTIYFHPPLYPLLLRSEQSLNSLTFNVLCVQLDQIQCV